MAKVLIHATVTMDGFMADSNGGVDWMFDFETVAEDFQVVRDVMGSIGAIVAGANKSQTIEDGEEPYGGGLKVPVYLMTHTPHVPVTKNDVTYHFVVDDLEHAVSTAKDASGDKYVSLLGGKIARQALRLELVDEIQLHVSPLILGDGFSLFAGLGQTVHLKRLATQAFADEIHLRFAVVR